jgi:hypothetical protein
MSFIGCSGPGVSVVHIHREDVAAGCMNMIGRGCAGSVGQLRLPSASAREAGKRTFRSITGRQEIEFSDGFTDLTRKLRRILGATASASMTKPARGSVQIREATPVGLTGEYDRSADIVVG